MVYGRLMQIVYYIVFFQICMIICKQKSMMVVDETGISFLTMGRDFFEMMGPWARPGTFGRSDLWRFSFFSNKKRYLK